MRYEPPAEGVLFEGDLGRAAALARGSGDYVAAGQPVGAVYFRPRCQRGFEAGRAVVPVMQMRIGAAGVFGPVTLFVHELKTAGGKRRLVIVEGCTYGNLYGLAHDLNCRVYELRGILSAAKLKSVQFAGPWSGPYEPAELGMGRSDPADASHFTIPYSYGGEKGTLDASLGEDELIHFTRRDGPGKGPATAGPGGFQVH